MIVGGILIALVLLIGIYVATTWAPELTVEELHPRFASPPSAFLNVAGMKVHMRDEGPRDDPSPIVLLHGSAASLHTWDGWAEALRSSRRVVRFDLPGFGLTGPSPDGKYSIDNAIRLLIAILDQLAIERAPFSAAIRSAGSSPGVPPWSILRAWRGSFSWIPEVIRRHQAQPRWRFISPSCPQSTGS